ncbi:MAG TPA: phosphoheptose isomerase [Cyanothece sp. UBA12306]|nr:phosphoheptose isomerase [Cyanothece sp. UBA12306]
MVTNPNLQQLYPFLHGKKQNPQAMNVALVESVQQKVVHHQQMIEDFFAHNSQQIVDAAGAIADVYRHNGRLYTMGNGGSSCDAAHIAVEFQHPITAGRPALTAIDLTSNIPMMTAVGNDVGFEHIFARQVIAQVRKEDALFGLSTSGNSNNLINAFVQAKEIGALTIGLTGTNGGKMTKINLDHCLVVPTDSVHRVQEVHLIIYHILWDLVHTLLADDRGNL